MAKRAVTGCPALSFTPPQTTHQHSPWELSKVLLLAVPGASVIPNLQAETAAGLGAQCSQSGTAQHSKAQQTAKTAAQPCSSTRQVRESLLEGGVAVCRQQLSVCPHIDASALSLLQEVVGVLQVVAAAGGRKEGADVGTEQESLASSVKRRCGSCQAPHATRHNHCQSFT
jgi:hypothetical protein